MPQGGASKKKKKGRAPAHQNNFAFKHNPKSKKTESILNSPNIHVCRRCHEKIEWRKKYRKYKPLTQPSKCNLCQQRKVKAAYHTICTACTTSDKARTAAAQKRKTERPQSSVEATVEPAESDPLESNPSTRQNDGADDSKAEPAVYRVCAVCVKEPALPCEDDDIEQNEKQLIGSTGRMRLREQRTLERKLARNKDGNKHRQPIEDTTEHEANSDTVENDHNKEGERVDRTLPSPNDEDPFLKAVGGAEKLLTGEAYQAMLLQRGAKE